MYKKYIILFLLAISSSLPIWASAPAAAAVTTAQNIAQQRQSSETLSIEPLNTALPLPALQNIVMGYLEGYTRKDLNFSDLEKCNPNFLHVSADGQYIVGLPLELMTEQSKSNMEFKIFKRTDSEYKCIQIIKFSTLTLKPVRISIAPNGKYIAISYDTNIKIYALDNEQYVEKQNLTNLHVELISFFNHNDQLYLGATLRDRARVAPPHVMCIWQHKNQEFQKSTHFVVTNNFLANVKILSSGRIFSALKESSLEDPDLDLTKIKTTYTLTWSTREGDFIARKVIEVLDSSLYRIDALGQYLIRTQENINGDIASSIASFKQIIWKIEDNNLTEFIQWTFNASKDIEKFHIHITSTSDNEAYVYIHDGNALNIFKIKQNNTIELLTNCNDKIMKTYFIGSTEMLIVRQVVEQNQTKLKFELWENSKEILAQEIKKKQTI